MSFGVPDTLVVFRQGSTVRKDEVSNPWQRKIMRNVFVLQNPSVDFSLKCRWLFFCLQSSGGGMRSTAWLWDAFHNNLFATKPSQFKSRCSERQEALCVCVCVCHAHRCNLQFGHLPPSALVTIHIALDSASNHGFLCSIVHPKLPNTTSVD